MRCKLAGKFSSLVNDRADAFGGIHGDAKLQFLLLLLFRNVVQAGIFIVVPVLYI